MCSRGPNLTIWVYWVFLQGKMGMRVGRLQLTAATLVVDGLASV